jgi:hypothetical protein
MTIQRGWTLQITGVVLRVRRQDLDKSGRNPKYMVRIQLNVEEFDDAGAGLELDSPARMQAWEKDIVGYLGRPLEVGDRIVVRSFSLEKRPYILRIENAEFAEPK